MSAGLPQNTEAKRTAAAFQAQAGKGRPKGVPNRTTTQLKDALLEAATQAGGKAGLVGYLKGQALQNPQSFLPLLGKVIPLQIAGHDGGAIKHIIDLSDATLTAIAAGQKP